MALVLRALLHLLPSVILNRFHRLFVMSETRGDSPSNPEISGQATRAKNRSAKMQVPLSTNTSVEAKEIKL